MTKCPCRFYAVILATFVSSVFALTGCDKELPSDDQPEVVKVYPSLIQAYESGKRFLSADQRPLSCVIAFEDGTEVVVPKEEFLIYNCRDSSPSSVAVNGAWWSVGNVTLKIKVDTSVSDKNAMPVYVYYDRYTLRMHLSNKSVLVFPSAALEEHERAEEELRRKQNIPVVRIFTDGGAGIYDKKNYVKGSITIEDPEKHYSDVTEFTGRMGIRGRGNSTWGWPKKPWKIKLDEKASLLGMPADKEWALLANYSDRTLVRNIVAMRLSEICGFSWTPRMRSVEVYLNGGYQGVYTLCEHKKVSSDRVDIDLVGEADNEGEAVTGGYYFEIEEQQDETTCWLTSMEVPMMFSDPEEPTARQLEYVKNLFESFEQTLLAKDWSEETGYPAYIDVDSFVDYYIVQELTKNIDGNLRKSSFITKERGKKLEMYHLWDFDITLGNCGYFWGQTGNGPEDFWIKYHKWYQYLFKDPAFVKKVQDRWNQLLPEFRQIPDFIDELVLSLDKAQKRNFQKWSIHESVDWICFPSLGTYEREVEYLKEFYTTRLNWLDRELSKL